MPRRTWSSPWRRASRRPRFKLRHSWTNWTLMERSTRLKFRLWWISTRTSRQRQKNLSNVSLMPIRNMSNRRAVLKAVESLGGCHQRDSVEQIIATRVAKSLWEVAGTCLWHPKTNSRAPYQAIGLTLHHMPSCILLKTWRAFIKSLKQERWMN